MTDFESCNESEGKSNSNNFDLSSLIMDNNNVIGQGKYGVVYKAQLLQTDTNTLATVAVKVTTILTRPLKKFSNLMLLLVLRVRNKLHFLNEQDLTKQQQWDTGYLKFGIICNLEFLLDSIQKI